ncbi:hypothetical protein TESG_08157 [Trichophyton tonsurans CBS 112818]|uniref:Uncharacterized protein n=1 Tax=Trichophyton tonsurans (strain CBS 112818) TaxID=647933 RepID=F2SB69_TRIT1|nr:hypothetical protein TESG_08157 [Trichophyton tonsurans CBS 112818]
MCPFPEKGYVWVSGRRVQGRCMSCLCFDTPVALVFRSINLAVVVKRVIVETLSAKNPCCLCVASCAALVEGIRRTGLLRPFWRNGKRRAKMEDAETLRGTEKSFCDCLSCTTTSILRCMGRPRRRLELKLVTNWRQRRDESVDASFNRPRCPFPRLREGTLSSPDFAPCRVDDRSQRMIPRQKWYHPTRLVELIPDPPSYTKITSGTQVAFRISALPTHSMIPPIRPPEFVIFAQESGRRLLRR